MSSLNALNCSVKLGHQWVLDNVTLEIPQGKLVGLLGPNGAGKSTLVRALSGLQKPDQGEVTLDNTLLSTFSSQQIAQRIAYLAQGAECDWPLTVERVVALGRTPHQFHPQLAENDYEIIERVMDAADVLHLVGRTINTLSGGERTRVMLARALASEPDYLLADEPVASLDPRHQLEVMALLAYVAHNGGAVVVVLHDLNLALRFCDHIVLLNKGKIMAADKPEKVLNKEMLKQVYGIDAKFIGYDEKQWILPWCKTEE